MLNKKYFDEYKKKLPAGLHRDFNKLKGNSEADFRRATIASAMHSFYIKGHFTKVVRDKKV